MPKGAYFVVDHERAPGPVRVVRLCVRLAEVGHHLRAQRRDVLGDLWLEAGRADNKIRSRPHISIILHDAYYLRQE